MVKLDGVYRFQCPRARAWNLLQDPVVLCDVITGCREMSLNQGEYRLTIKIGVSMVAGTYRATVRINESSHLELLRLSVTGSGMGGGVRGNGLVTLAENAEHTEVTVTGQAHVTGLAAIAGERTLNGLAKSMADQFFSRLAVRVEQAAAGY